MLMWPIVSVPGLLAGTAVVSAPGIRSAARYDAERGCLEAAATEARRPGAGGRALVGRRR
jgi:hypothetical protein